MSDVTRILDQAQKGDSKAAEELLPLVYRELRRLATAKMPSENPGHTLQATARVYEAWLRLGADQQPRWRDRAQFSAAAGEAMRRILGEAARRKTRLKHGGQFEFQPVQQAALEIPIAVPDEEILSVNVALERLAAEAIRRNATTCGGGRAHWGAAGAAGSRERAPCLLHGPKSSVAGIRVDAGGRDRRWNCGVGSSLQGT